MLPNTSIKFNHLTEIQGFQICLIEISHNKQIEDKEERSFNHVTLNKT